MASPTPSETIANVSPAPLPEYIQPFTLHSPTPDDSTEQLNPKPSDTTQPEEEQEASDEIPNQPEKRKRKEATEEEEEENNGEPKRALHPLWKTSLCSFFRSQSGECSHGETCRFAHGEEELRARPDNSWDPTSDRAKEEENLKIIEPMDEKEDVMITETFGDSVNPALDKYLKHLPRKWAASNLKDYLDEQGVIYKTANKKKGMAVGFVSFETPDQAEKAIKGLEGNFLFNKRIKVGDVIPRSFEKKTPTVSANEDSEITISLDDPNNEEIIEQNDPNVDSSALNVRRARDAVTPLANMPYNSQLEHKKKLIEQILKSLTRNARKACPKGISIPEWIVKSKEIGRLACKLEGILESPRINGYRNKCEFSVGYSLQGKPTVGFMLGNFREGVTAVEEPTDCPNVSIIAYKYASIFHEFLEHSGLPLWNRLNNIGFWRQLTVREGRHPDQAVDIENHEANISEVMLMVQVCPVGYDNEIIKGEYQRMAQAFSQGATASSPCLPLTLLVVQDHIGISNVAPPDCPLQSLPIPKADSSSEQEAANSSMEPRIHDYISNLRFSISPTSFFQVNTLAAEKLYSLAGDWAGLGPDTLLFDICCGTGTIGLTLAHRVGMVVGIEMNASAVSDAQRNAEINGIKNCKFVCAKAEAVMGSLLKEYLDVPNKQEEASYAPESNGTGVSDDKEESVSEDKPNLDSLTHADADTNMKSPYAQNNGEDLKDPSRSCYPEVKNGQIDFPGMQYKNVVAIVDPPRAGLHHVVTKVLRTHPRLRRLVYISCNPESLVANAIELCTPSTVEKDKGSKDNWRPWKPSAASLARHRAKSMPTSEPFRPVKAMAVDLFPHTSHCEMVMLLER